MTFIEASPHPDPYLLALDLDEDGATLQVRTAGNVAEAARGLLRDLAPGIDLAADLIADRRKEAERDEAAEAPARR